MSGSDRTSLSRRDLLVLRWVGELRGLPWGTVAWLLARESGSDRVEPVDVRTVRGWVRRMEARGLVRSQSLGGSMWLVLSHRGAGAMGLPWNRYGLRLSELDHMAAISEVRFWMEANYGGSWVPEHAFRTGSPGEPATRRPDGGWQAEDRLVAVEVELSRKASFRQQYAELVRKLPADVDECWWFTSTREDLVWLQGRLAGVEPLLAQVRLLPFLSLPALHPDWCECLPCRGFRKRMELPLKEVVG